jgi:hypothetical protein
MSLGTLSENELEAWFDHLAAVFETTGREYFVRHWINDPSKSFDGRGVKRGLNERQLAHLLKIFLLLVNLPLN